MARKLEEWIGRTDDHRAPKTVRDRVMDRTSRTCHLCNRPISLKDKYDIDHVKALINGGENRETNLAPAHRDCHKVKTAEDVALKAKAAKQRQKHLRIVDTKQKIPGAPMPVTRDRAKQARASTKLPLPPRKNPLYREARS
jgi:5-methylcytosine-specific restriction protein A